ncbi:hypothetical protein SAMN05216201_10947 [Pseudomonas linyingensis]|uniref:Uncharacterized protein n=1 Tax=Pseudomonas linyingensis TaxID=915471 RepID=A0A1H6YXA2_9PSED|nr:hypothetical protein [Pseudomonas linyingensis]SEJ45848.1 hypothetical protein SAMN05216201_10947 [Pseudomonas linyingensis]
MNKPFAKHFDVDGIGQILVVQRRGDDGPELAITFRMPNNSVCDIKLGYPDDDDGWDQLDAAFDQVDESTAASLAREQIEVGPFAKLGSIDDEDIGWEQVGASTCECSDPDCLSDTQLNSND